MDYDLIRAKKQFPNVIYQEEIANKKGILAANKYMPEDFVSMDQFVVKRPKNLQTGYNNEEN